MSVHVDVIYRHARRLATELASPSFEEVDLLLALAKAQACSRRLLSTRNTAHELTTLAGPLRGEHRAGSVSVQGISANAA